MKTISRFRLFKAYHENKRFSCSFAGCEAKLATRGKLAHHMKALHENQKRPKISRKSSKSHKKNPKKPIAALLTGAVLPREVERAIIVDGKTFELSLPELSQEVAALKSDSEMEDSGIIASVEIENVPSLEVSIPVVHSVHNEKVSNQETIFEKPQTESVIGSNNVNLDLNEIHSQSGKILMSSVNVNGL